MPRHCRTSAYQLFTRQLPRLQESGSLLAAAVAIATHEMPDATITDVDRALEDIAAKVRGRVSSRRPEAFLAHLHEILFEEMKFHGNQDDYYDPGNSYLPVVLETKRGIPITLCLVYKLVGDRLGLDVQGVNAPNHFLVSVTADGAEMFVDPFFGGRSMSRTEAYDRLEQTLSAPVDRNVDLLPRASHRAWLQRMLRNLQAIFQQRGQVTELAAMTELAALLQESPTEG